MGALAYLMRPTELAAMVKLKLKIRKWQKRAEAQERDADWVFCYDMLNKVSRSFAIVIQQLGDELRNAVCVFYLVLRGLDTVEDDMAIPTEEKAKLLLNFYESIEDEGFTLSCGYKDEKILVENFDKVVRAYKSLKPEYRATIKEITRRMAEGMQKFTVVNVVKTAEYDEYCHYVAGLVGIGLSSLFADSGLENPSIGEQEDLANHMGLFLQKTNIIRDFLEDHEDVNDETGDRRVFWPQEIWKNYTDQLSDITFGKNSDQAIACLNHMVTDALRHVPYCLEYLSAIENEQNFLFCAIPQVMAAHTLSMCYANPKVFLGVIHKDKGECRNQQPVKLRKGMSAKLMLDTNSMPAVLDIFEEAVESIADRIAPCDPSANETLEMIQQIRDLINRGRRSNSPTSKLAESNFKVTAFKNAKWMATSLLMPLMGVLMAITLAVDVPQVLGKEQWLMVSAPTETVPMQGIVTLWCLLFYSATLYSAMGGSPSSRKNFTSLAVFHVVLAVVQFVFGFVQGAGARILAAEALPKLLAGSCLMLSAPKPFVQELTPSHLNFHSERIRAVQ